MKIKIQRISARAALPEYSHGPAEDAGMDLRAVDHTTLAPGIPQAVATAATIDPGYRGEIKVILLNLGHANYEIQPGDRIAQMVIARYEAIEWEETELSASNRGTGGFG